MVGLVNFPVAVLGQKDFLSNRKLWTWDGL